MIKKYYQYINPNKFHDELINTGIYPLYVGNDLQQGEHMAKNVEIWLDGDTDIAVVDNLVVNHNPEPAMPEPTIEDMLLEHDMRITLIELGVI